jgi:hypothetical protein
MWYLAEILLAEQPKVDSNDYQCESCNVLFNANSAEEALRKAEAWGNEYVKDPPSNMQLLGVSSLTTVGDELGDGTDIGGRLFNTQDVWLRRGEMVPCPSDLSAIKWENADGKTVGELLSPEQIEQLRRLWKS